jgi:hypothetical protein
VSANKANLPANKSGDWIVLTIGGFAHHGCPVLLG